MAYLKNHSWHLFFIRNLFFYHLVLLRSCFPATLYMYVFLYVYSLPSWLSGKKKKICLSIQETWVRSLDWEDIYDKCKVFKILEKS